MSPKAQELGSNSRSKALLRTEAANIGQILELAPGFLSSCHIHQGMRSSQHKASVASHNRSLAEPSKLAQCNILPTDCILHTHISAEHPFSIGCISESWPVKDFTFACEATCRHVPVSKSTIAVISLSRALGLQICPCTLR